ncbi:hypothetical protein M413DRAFT_25905 [Hebeloma cylindrosporum]|uniref:Uncharacterized protein n=1 Tax=Hebeloma cylindrosporum TaxID=76867 RepID=A0A0C3CHB5_HEBCY|nr:hypothetical protein M413DRAFT_25905 [Hebeloma cylindrosporum h7]
MDYDEWHSRRYKYRSMFKPTLRGHLPYETPHYPSIVLTPTRPLPSDHQGTSDMQNSRTFSGYPQTAMTPYVPRSAQHFLPSPPVTPIPTPDSDGLLAFPCDSRSRATTPGAGSPFPPLRMDGEFWANSHPSYTGTGSGEVRLVGMPHAPQLESDVEESVDEDSDSEMSAHGDSQSIEDFDEVRIPTGSHRSRWQSTSVTPGYGEFIRRPRASQNQEYEQWLESQVESSEGSSSPEIHSPIPRQLLGWFRAQVEPSDESGTPEIIPPLSRELEEWFYSQVEPSDSESSSPEILSPIPRRLMQRQGFPL